ncbi:flavin-containing monooxygenase [Paraburkholderia atlantica]|uniref:flavin-containing monooxygenase n=1 Tax=Paraburkholderia atlantica TaxID=2654982 RepID=UPI00182B905B|nr:NAD(P)/FAD-dependent oxidoreductase [Paraburkholderia atlantica]MBB5415795.1 putative flavoprotein involved in K+ transport [Paraburkholderia atlantica]
MFPYIKGHRANQQYGVSPTYYDWSIAMAESSYGVKESSVQSMPDIERVQHWLSSFDEALRGLDASALEALFIEDAHWRDLLAFTWTITPSDGRKAVVDRLLSEQPRVQAHGFRIAEGRTGPRRLTRAGVEVVEAIMHFETAVGRGQGVLRMPTANPGRAWVISTSLRELKGFEEPIGPNRPDGSQQRTFGGEPWGERRAKDQLYVDREPAVLIVGGGHNGIELAARLRLLNVDALVVERLPKVGDVWRRRYSALALHNGIELNHLPYLQYPSSWPRYLPKDMLGDWIESYARTMECNVWTNTTFVEGRFDEKRGVWNARVRLGDGTERILHPRHLVFANGVVGEPNVPDVPGLRDFKGELIHSHHFDSGAKWDGKKVMVLGVGNTAHDIAQDLHAHGAKVKMIQRGSLTVFSVKSASINHSIYYNEGLPLDDCDLIVSCNTFEVLLRGYKIATQRMLENDKELLDGLQAKGFKLDIGAEGGGHQMKVRASHGGYYLNVGCSDLIVNGEIGLLQYSDIERFVPDGALMKDGRIEPADLVVTATGYQSPHAVVQQLLGNEIAQKLGPVWGMDEGGEMCNMYKPTPQKGLWFTGGGFAQARIWTHYIALQIKAREAGIVTDEKLPEPPKLHPMSGRAIPYGQQSPAATTALASSGAAAGTDGL